ncbi:MAG: DUF4199 domain-containing protein [Bacteroidota bacterium]
MKKIVITYGLIAGLIVGGLMLASLPLWKSGAITFDNGELVGYTTMVIALSTIFIGIKSYRDNHAGGIITFWSGCKIGLLITLIAGIMYAMAWEVSFANMGEEFTQKMTEHYLAEIQAGGASEAELQKAREEWAAFSELYQNPLVRFPITLLEILPVGIIITLLSAGLLRKKEFLPSAETNHA